MLNCNIEKVEDWKKKINDKNLEATKELLINWSLMYRIPAITEANVKEVWYRLNALDRIHGGSILTIRWGGGDVHNITFEDVKAWIGLHTNNSPMTKKQWDKFCGDYMRTHIEEYL